MKRRVNYYTDERTDDFAGTSIRTVQVPADYKYIRRGVLYRLFSFVLYRLIATPFALLFARLRHGMKVRGRKALKSCRGKGIFVYANHTLTAGDAFFPSLVAFPRRTYIVTGADSVSLPLVGRLTPMLGALPLPSGRAGYRNFTSAIAERIKEGGCVYVYPEAHIWPYYTGIRDFPDASLLYPVLSGAPVYAATTVFRKRRFFTRPRCEVYVDGPYFADPSLSPADAKAKLKEEVRAAMLRRSAVSDCEFVRYVRAENDAEACKDTADNL